MSPFAPCTTEVLTVADLRERVLALLACAAEIASRPHWDDVLLSGDDTWTELLDGQDLTDAVGEIALLHEQNIAKDGSVKILRGMLCPLLDGDSDGVADILTERRFLAGPAESAATVGQLMKISPGGDLSQFSSQSRETVRWCLERSEKQLSQLHDADSMARTLVRSLRSLRD